MEHITVTYTLTEEQAKRLEELTKTWNTIVSPDDPPSTSEGLFQFMMELGSLYTINDKLTFFEEYAARTAKREA